MNNKTLSGICVASSLTAVAVSLFAYTKVKKMFEVLDIAIDDISNDIPVNISDKIVDTAVKNAVDKEVSIVANKAAVATSIEITSIIRKEVKATIANQVDTISNLVSDEAERQIHAIDSDLLSKKIEKQAEKKIMEKFDGQLNGILDTFNKELRNVSKIYSSIASTFVPKETTDKPIYFKL